MNPAPKSWPPRGLGPRRRANAGVRVSWYGIAIGAVLATIGVVILPAVHAAQVATGFASHVLCDDVLVAGRDAALVFHERIEPVGAMRVVAWAMRRSIDAP